METHLRRMLGAARLDAATYEAIEADANATGPAMVIVVCASLAAGIGDRKPVHEASNIMWPVAGPMDWRGPRSM